MTLDIENFIEGQYRRYISNGVEPNLEYIALYDGITDERLKTLFSAMHADSIYLFDRMNSRLPTGDDTQYYWADESRGVIKLIDVATTLRDELKDTELSFHIDEYYDDVFIQCSQWLEQYRGSLIPAHTEKIKLYYRKPLFIPDGVMPMAELHALGEEMEVLGRGGFGEVYRYRHPILEMDFAVKVFNPIFASDEDRIEGEKRFFREAKMLFRLNHPNIVRIYDVGRIKGRPFIKIEFVDGKTLDKVHQQYSNLPFANAGRAILQILSGLQHAHESGIIHRDLKPTNVMVATEGWKCKIIDFGISAFMDTEGYTKLTKTGEQIAGGAYIDPELMRRPDLRDVRSDIYSVGAIMYFLLCGHPPGPDAEAYLKKSNEHLKDSQIAIVMKALSSDIYNRYKTCDEMLAALKLELKR